MNQMRDENESQLWAPDESSIAMELLWVMRSLTLTGSECCCVSTNDLLQA